jgi:RNA polymerase sigma-B factor
VQQSSDIDFRRAHRQSELLRRYHLEGDARAKRELAELMLPLARSIAARYGGRGEPLDDLVQVACIGILKAIDGFDVTRDVHFSSYAVPTVLGEIKRYFRDRTWSVRPPRGLQELQLRVTTARERLSRELGRPPTVHELSDKLAVSAEDVLEALQVGGARHARSLSAPVGDDITLADTLGGGDPELGRAELRAVLDGPLSVLSERERTILWLRFEEDLTQTEIARIVGVSQMQISRLIRQSLARMRLRLEMVSPDQVPREGNVAA